MRVAVLVVATLLVGCGFAAPSGSESPSAPTEPAVDLTCGSDTRFPASALLTGESAETAAGAGAEALRALLASADGSGLPPAGWVAVAEQADRVEFVARNATTGGWSHVVLTLDGGRLVVDEAGDCVPEVALPEGVGRADWWLDPDVPAPEPGDKVVNAILRERACASGQSPEDRLEPPTIVYQPDAILITLAVRQREGAQDCQGNPAVPLEIELEEPIGKREIVDAGVWPPRDASGEPEN